MSAWVVPFDDLGAARADPRAQDPPPAPHLRDVEGRALDVALEVELNGEVVARPNARDLYWTPEQMLAHMTSNGARVTAGDVFATGSISGPGPGTEGSLAEIARGERWLSDGDEVVLRGRAGDIDLGEVRGRIAGGGSPAGTISHTPWLCRGCGTSFPPRPTLKAISGRRRCLAGLAPAVALRPAANNFQHPAIRPTCWKKCPICGQNFQHPC